jgi:hypothetical protein
MRYFKSFLAVGLVAGALALFAQADDDTDIKTPLVTLKMQSVLPNDVIDAFSKQTGVKLLRPTDENGDERRRVSLDIHDKTFSEALDVLGSKCRIAPQDMNERGEMRLGWRGDSKHVFGKRPKSVGPLATFLVNSISRENSLNLDADDPEVSKSSTITFTPYIDPRLHVIRWKSEADIEKAEDENGDSILHQDDSNNQPSMNGIQPTWEFQPMTTALDYDAAKSKKLAVFKGSLHVTAALVIELFQVDDLQNAQGTEKAVEGLRVMIDDVSEPEPAEDEAKDQHSTVINLSIFREGIENDAWDCVVSRISNSIKLLDAKGKEIEQSFGETNQDDSKTSYTVTANWKQASDRPAKFSLLIPTKLQEVDLPFEFHDLKLP